MKENYEKLKYLIAGSEITSDRKGYKSYKFVVPRVMEIDYTIYDVGEDFIFIYGDYFSSTYWFDELKIEDDEYGCTIGFKDRGTFIGSVRLKSIYLEDK